MQVKNFITWGVDGKGCRHYLCNHCEIRYGTVKPNHTHCTVCNAKTKQYSNRDKFINQKG